MSEVMQYIRYFKNDSDYNNERQGDYYEPWLSLTEKTTGGVKSFIGEVDMSGDGTELVDEQFNHVYENSYINEEITESVVTVDNIMENHTVTVDGIDFYYNGNFNDIYVFDFEGYLPTRGTVERVWIEEIEFEGETMILSACTVDSTTFAGYYYDYVIKKAHL